MASAPLPVMLGSGSDPRPGVCFSPFVYLNVTVT